MAFNKLAVAKSLAIHLALALPLTTIKTTTAPKKLVSTVVFKSQAEQSLGDPSPTLVKKKLTLNKKSSVPKGHMPVAINSLEAKEDGLAGSLEKTEAVSQNMGFRPAPVLLSKDVTIPYPEKAKLLAIEGSVLLRLTISQEGKVIKADVVNGHFELRKAALKLADKLFFLPATDDRGLGKVALVDHEVVFRLRQT